MASSSKRQKAPLFQSDANKECYDFFSKQKFNKARPLNPEKIHERYSRFFKGDLLKFLKLNESFSSKFIHRFYSNLSFSHDLRNMYSFVEGKNIDFNHAECHLLDINMIGTDIFAECEKQNFNWSDVNMTLRGVNNPNHLPLVKELTNDAKIVQYVVRTNILPKAGDRKNITPPISLITHHILNEINFSLASVIFNHMFNLVSLRNMNSKRKTNLAYGHVITLLLKYKYEISTSLPINEHHTEMRNYDFSRVIKGVEEEGGDREEEVEIGEEAAPMEEEEVREHVRREEGEPSYITEISRSINRINTNMETLNTRFDEFGQRFTNLDNRVENLSKNVEDQYNQRLQWEEEDRKWKQSWEQRYRPPSP